MCFDIIDWRSFIMAWKPIIPDITKYFYKNGIAVDQLINTILGGYPNETLSARAWRMGEIHHHRGWHHFRLFVDKLFFFDKNHCEECFLYGKKVTKTCQNYLPLYCECYDVNKIETKELPMDSFFEELRNS